MLPSLTSVLSQVLSEKYPELDDRFDQKRVVSHNGIEVLRNSVGLLDVVACVVDLTSTHVRGPIFELQCCREHALLTPSLNGILEL